MVDVTVLGSVLSGVASVAWLVWRELRGPEEVKPK